MEKKNIKIELKTYHKNRQGINNSHFYHILLPSKWPILMALAQSFIITVNLNVIMVILLVVSYFWTYLYSSIKLFVHIWPTVEQVELLINSIQLPFLNKLLLLSSVICIILVHKISVIFFELEERDRNLDKYCTIKLLLYYLEYNSYF